jgi:FixJ family two-component response regulator
VFAPQVAKAERRIMNQNLIPWSESYQTVTPVGEIFVVDDDEDIREIVAITLARQGFPVKTFEDGEAFLRVAGERAPICVFLDIVMPQRSGLEVLQELRARRYCAPIILTSARDDVPTVVEAMRNGAHDYIKKPFDPQVVVPRVRNAVEMWLRRGETANPGDIQANENREWFRLTPIEKDMLLLMRLMDTHNEEPATFPRS